jgi:putative ABC transport system ATP-binding protein
VSIDLKEVVKHYRSGSIVRAVDGVSMTIGPGEVVALFGPSGSGKTTLLKLVGALVAPDSGVVLYRGNDVSRFTRQEQARYLRKEVGLVSQNFNLMPTSALNNAAAKLVADGKSLREGCEIARPWLERVGLGARLGHRPEQLSMGERQRVTLARALASDPGVLLADEPTGNLDSERSREVLELLRDIAHERRIPALIVTHDATATRLVDRTFHLRDGRLEDSAAVAPSPCCPPGRPHD